jgi:tRNA-specific 2-thiouridylase
VLLEQGYEVIGITMRLWTEGHRPPLPENDGPSPVVADARQVCDALGIPLRILDARDVFRQKVVDYFCDSYALGRTPNPCLACNREIKFKELLRFSLDLGAEFLATGHYARIRGRDGKYQLLRGIDKEKDQGYVLYMLGQEQLSHLLFPLGSYTKQEVRAVAARYRLPTANRNESQDVCFVREEDYRDFVVRQRPDTRRPGPICDLQGHVLGRHQGIASYTIGQREKLGICASYPLYVLEIDAVNNTLVVGPKAALLRRALLAEQVSFVSGSPPEDSVSITAKVRYKAEEAPATLSPLPRKTAKVVFAYPQPAIAPGQAVVFYEEDLVLGGGIIASAGPIEG